MIIITGKKEFKIDNKTAVAIGKFDGIHIGHKALLDIIRHASKEGLKTAVFTFDPPFEELFGNGDAKYLLTRDEKRKMFEDMGVDYLIEFPMDRESAGIEPDDFVSRYIADYLNAKLVVCGSDLSFGAFGKGDYELLKSKSSEYGYEAVSIDKISLDNNVISSTLIRSMIGEGNMQKAAKYLGYHYYISGIVIHGNAIGRTMGVPTINLSLDEKKIVPPYGVYYSKTIVNGKEYKSITNIGTKPTIKSDSVVNAETFIYDFNENLYDDYVLVSLIEFKRPERTFNNLDELKEQITKDIQEGKLYT